ncbi:hypothetical protein ARHIZOSPH14_01110 [Agromyces rhizosphaerae]|uniref:Anti-sigma K factor RskA C-terminal domain-containing protein n=2 Tax=Agromyces rhizosphaerae TaxID=88374 RepID=A0A9W6CV16_9MICO|nr:hypothetical protein ARHIZOSPH14_01110 [Agromyces rhizosphaerae]
MLHCDDDELAVIALGDREPTLEERDHLDGCLRCTGELDALRAASDLAREAAGAPLETPPASVWAGIHAELGLAEELRATPADASEADAAPAAPATVAPPADVPPAPVDLAERRRARGARFWAPLLAAAAVLGLVAGIGGGIWWNSREPDPTVLAEADLEGFPDWPGASGVAVVEELPDGTREVVVDLAGVEDPDDLLEVWLIRGDASGLVSIGLLDGATGRFTVPAGIDLGEYPLVDVSAEPDDGDPAHSGDSIVRGDLRGA